MKDYKHFAEGLALYFGAECEYEEYMKQRHGGDWVWRFCTIDLVTAHYFSCIGYRNPTLFLRPLSAMTEEEWIELDKVEGWPYTGSRPKTGKEIGYFLYWSENARIIDWLRSKGFDCGGWAMKGKDRVWVDSFLDVGLAKVKEAGND